MSWGLLSPTLQYVHPHPSWRLGTDMRQSGKMVGYELLNNYLTSVRIFIRMTLNKILDILIYKKKNYVSDGLSL